MSEPTIAELSRLNSFFERWRGELESHAQTSFHCALRGEDFRPHHEIADEFVQSHGFRPIGFNWEMLDAAPSASGPRAAEKVISEALTTCLVHGGEWLGETSARECASEFVGALRPVARTILSNRYDGLWNPITAATIEYAFVGFDDRKIALLVVAADD